MPADDNHLDDVVNETATPKLTLLGALTTYLFGTKEEIAPYLELPSVAKIYKSETSLYVGAIGGAITMALGGFFGTIYLGLPVGLTFAGLGMYAIVDSFVRADGIVHSPSIIGKVRDLPGSLKKGLGKLQKDFGNLRNDLAGQEPKVTLKKQ